MNAADFSFEEQEIRFRSDSRVRDKKSEPQLAPQGRESRRRGKRPSSMNGIHRRKSRRFAW